MMIQNIDEFYMRRCLQLARNGRQNAKPNPMVGAVIVTNLKSQISKQESSVRATMPAAERAMPR